MQSSNLPHIHFRELRLYTDVYFKGRGDDLRLAITGAFSDRSVLHNHRGDMFDYRSPRVRYLVLNGIPRLISFDEGLDVLEEIYKTGGQLRVRGKKYSITGTELNERIEPIGVVDDLITYRSISPWLGLNQQNFSTYKTLRSDEKKRTFLSNILVGNFLSFCKTANVYVTDKILLTIQYYSTVRVKINQQIFQGFKLQFVTNALIPELIGLGKMVSKGFGVVKRI